MNNTKLKDKIPYKVITSLTSFPSRIDKVHLAIKTLLTQTVKPDKIILWLATDEFPEKEKNLPRSLLILKQKGLSIQFVENNIRSHKKYYFAMQEYPEAIIITADDDLLYSNKLVEYLLKSYIKYPYAISALRNHRMKVNAEGFPLKYNIWEKEVTLYKKPSLLLFPTTGAGVLYPPRCLHKEVFNLENIKNLCPYADDIWLKVMAILNNTPTVVAHIQTKLNVVEGIDEDTSLAKINVLNSQNDVQLKSVMKIYNHFFGYSDTLTNRLKISASKEISLKMFMIFLFHKLIHLIEFWWENGTIELIKKIFIKIIDAE
ncbi:hypothetical protein AN396_11690 [Candidatus Epulonipiscium fishelsonii]|uniref:Uncharacterized protein n=1 Tax=Candidatus Epulonipiscium fishelsonii TaxID=77094 RepID=A0ACC8X810_9FIRM|nr:hypothetical protein AN396_11690 [Epulopiscium sp. SCG-B11WGA-EpuloA1]